MLWNPRHYPKIEYSLMQRYSVEIRSKTAFPCLLPHPDTVSVTNFYSTFICEYNLLPIIVYCQAPSWYGPLNSSKPMPLPQHLILPSYTPAEPKFLPVAVKCPLRDLTVIILIIFSKNVLH